MRVQNVIFTAATTWHILYTIFGIQKPKNIFVLPFFRVSAYYFHCFSQSFAFRMPLLLSLSSLFVCEFIYVYVYAIYTCTITPTLAHKLLFFFFVFLTCTSQFVCLEFYYTEKVFSFISFLVCRFVWLNNESEGGVFRHYLIFNMLCLGKWKNYAY